MLLLTGAMLVVLTWLVSAAVLVAWGLLPALWSHHTKFDLRDLSRSVWWGLAIVIAVLYALHFVWPLDLSYAVFGLLLLTAILGVPGIMLAIRRGSALREMAASPRLPVILVSMASGIAAITLAVFALGPVTHYDAGLYQVAAGWYAGDFPAIPGLANLYGPLGYASAEPVLAAALSAGPLGDESFRAVNGFFLLILCGEVIIRLMRGPRNPAAPIGMTALIMVMVPMLWMADFWVSSPTPDLPVLVICIVALLYFVDAVTDHNSFRVSAPLVVVLSGILIALRPTMAPLAGLLILATWLIAYRRRAIARFGPLLVATGLTISLTTLIIMRDRVLSGWALYPLSFLPFDVPWRAPDPSGLREATLGFARNPADYQSAISGWNWIPEWLGRWPQQWDPWWIVAWLLLGLALMVVARMRGIRVHARDLSFVCAPFIGAALVWFFLSPPAFRFGWGPLFALASLFTGWAVWRLGKTQALTISAALIIAPVAIVSLATRYDWQSPRAKVGEPALRFEVVPLPLPSVGEVRYSTGLSVQVPLQGDQCWARYPLCTPIPPENLALIGDDIASGLVP